MSESYRKYLICFILFFMTLSVYGQVKDFDFINLDDKMYILDNRHVLSGLNADNVRWAFTSFHASNWHPLTWISHMLDVQLFGVHAGRFHMVNVLFHLAATLLLFIVLNRMTRALWQSAFVAALFALHPLHVESVAWISERKDVLSTFFWMLSLGAYALYVEKPQPLRYIAVLCFFILGLMSKPMLVTLPFVLLLLDFWPLNRLQVREPLRIPGMDPSVKGKGKNKGRKKGKPGTVEARAPAVAEEIGKTSLQWSRFIPLIREKIPFFVLSAASSLVTVYAQHKGGAMTLMDSLPVPGRIANAMMSYVLYIGKTIWPQDLAVFYPYPGAWPLWQAGGAFFLLSAITLLTVSVAKRRPYLIVGWFWYLGTLAPVIGIVQVGMQAMADRYTYMPMIGLLIMAAWGIGDLVMKGIRNRSMLIAAAGVTILVFSVIAWHQIGHWQNSVTLFRHALAVTTNNYLAHNNLGVALNSTGDSEGAVLNYSEAIRLHPKYAGAHYNLANYLAAHGRIEEAVSHYRESTRLAPDYFNAHNNLAFALASRGEFREAAFHYGEALRIRPEAGGVHYNMAVMLAKQGDPGASEGHLREAIRIEPNFAEAHNDLGMLLAMQGKTEEAIVHFREALQLKPQYAAAAHNLRLALEDQNRKR